MDLLSIIRTLGGLGVVLGILWGALWLVRRYDIQLPGLAGGARRSRLELVERLAIDPRRSVTLLRRDGMEHLILLAPEGHLVIETGVLPTADDAKVKVDSPKTDSATTDIVAEPVAERGTRWENLFGPNFARPVDGPKAMAESAEPDFVSEPRGNRTTRWEKLFGPSLVRPVDGPLGNRATRWEKLFGPSLVPAIDGPLGDRPTRWEKLFGPSFGALVEEANPYGVPFRPVASNADADSIYPPTKKTSTRRRKAAGAAAHA